MNTFSKQYIWRRKSVLMVLTDLGTDFQNEMFECNLVIQGVNLSKKRISQQKWLPW